MADTRVQSKYLGKHEVAAGAKDAAAPTEAQLIKNTRFDSLLSVTVELTGAAGTVAITAYAGTGDAIGENNGFGLAGKQVIVYGGTAVKKTYPLLSHGKDVGFYVDDNAGGNITPACTIKVNGSSEN